MSNLNKSFIKAYRKSTTEAKPATPGPRPHFVPAPTVSVQPTAIASVKAPIRPPRKVAIRSAPSIEPMIAEASVITAPPRNEKRQVVVTPGPVEHPAQAQAVEAIPVTVVDHAHPGIRAPHANFIDPPRQAASAASTTSAPPTASVTSAVDSLPVSPRPVILPISGPSPIWRPVFEVSSFVWPELTDVLLEAAGPQFRAAAGDLAEACRRHRKLVTITASRRGEGCTVVGIALAKALADQQQRVILVDAHFNAPGLADSLGLAAQVGLEDTLTGEKPLIEALVESLADRVVVLPLRQPAAADWRLSIAHLKSSLDELRRHCDIVLIDAGPCGDAGDRRRLLSWAAPCRVDRAWSYVICARRATTRRPKSNDGCTAVASRNGTSSRISGLPSSATSTLGPIADKKLMYEAYWKLRAKSFAATCDARAYYPTETHQGSLKLRYAIENRRGAALDRPFWERQVIAGATCWPTSCRTCTGRSCIWYFLRCRPKTCCPTWRRSWVPTRRSLKPRTHRPTAAFVAFNTGWRKSLARESTPSWPSTKRT